MDDASKLAAAAAAREREQRDSQSDKTSESFVAYMDDSAVQAGAGRARAERPATTARALDRWFRERQNNQGAPRLLEVPNEALVSAGGPLQITGNITLVTEDGSVRHANHLTLCRCGHSQSKPTCDGHHSEREFLHPGKIAEASEVAASARASKLTISCIRNGPVTFQGRLRLHNQYGQECVKMRGSLCRCGHSANKPFCDGSHERVGFRTGS
jgi:CDGSH-type Zn-finger protein